VKADVASNSAGRMGLVAYSRVESDSNIRTLNTASTIPEEVMNERACYLEQSNDRLEQARLCALGTKTLA
jgi:hypothetical protein